MRTCPFFPVLAFLAFFLALSNSPAAAADQSTAALAADETAAGPEAFSCANVTQIPQVECEALCRVS